VSSPPDKDRVFGNDVFVWINSLALWTLPLYSLTGTPRNATGHGKGKRKMHHFAPVIESINTSPLCFAQQNIGEKQRNGSDDERGWKYGI